jgi:hypothetical protein
MNINVFLKTVKPNKDDILIEPFPSKNNYGGQIQCKTGINIVKYGESSLRRNFIYSNVHYPLNNVHIFGVIPTEYIQSTITKACSIANTISVVLPCKNHYLFTEDFKLIHSGDINTKDQTIFQIWGRGECENELFYRIVNPEIEAPSFAIRRYGIFVGKLVFDTSRLYFNDYFFIRLNDGVDINLILLLFKSIKFDKRVLSKSELISKLNAIIPF